jgi:hypothetical protein
MYSGKLLYRVGTWGKGGCKGISAQPPFLLVGACSLHMHKKSSLAHSPSSPRPPRSLGLITLSATRLELFAQKSNIFLLDKSEADFLIRILRWICTREYHGRATPQYKWSFEMIWEVLYYFRVDLPVFFFTADLYQKVSVTALFGQVP